MLAKSSGPSTERILYFLYSLFLGFPSTNTTIDATGSVPWMFEMSKHSIRRGRRSSRRSFWSDCTPCGIASDRFRRWSFSSSSRNFALVAARRTSVASSPSTGTASVTVPPCLPESQRSSVPVSAGATGTSTSPGTSSASR